ncbi:MAG: flagellar protein FliS [Leptolinea sp.]|nr:flagellar protein FliS [Leptolinea sp.]
MYNQSHAYRKQEVLSASPLHLVIMAYDLAIRSCDQKDMATALKAVSALRDALDYNYAEIAMNLLSLYNWCLDCIRKQEYAQAKQTLIELREAWVTIENQMNAPKVQAVSTGVSMAVRSA